MSSDESQTYDTQAAQAIIDADRDARIAEFKKILEEAMQQLRIEIVVEIESVPLGGGIYGQKGVVRFVAK